MVQSRLTYSQKKELFRMWRAGFSQSEIARSLSRTPGGIRHVLMQSGGYTPADPQRSCRHLRIEERETISRGLANGETITSIARELNRPVSTISREITRNGGNDTYRAIEAEKRAWQRGKRPKACKLAQRATLGKAVATKLHQYWSPQQIAGWLKNTYPSNAEMQISHETIYKSLFVQTRGVLKRELSAYLRSHRTFRHGHTSTAQRQGRGGIVDALTISQRPAEVSQRAVPGHWEGDLIAGTQDTFIATLVERSSRYVMLVKVPNKEAASVAKALTKAIKKLPTHLRRSLTWDRGMEMAHHKTITVDAKIDIYFCDPRSPWQRGSNENTNGLLRQFFPKGTDLNVFSQSDLNAVATLLNQRPRQTLKFKTPAEVYSAFVALTA